MCCNVRLSSRLVMSDNMNITIHELSPNSFSPAGNIGVI